MSNHGNPTLGKRVNTRGEPTNHATAGRSAPRAEPRTEPELRQMVAQTEAAARAADAARLEASRARLAAEDAHTAAQAQVAAAKEASYRAFLNVMEDMQQHFAPGEEWTNTHTAQAWVKPAYRAARDAQQVAEQQEQRAYNALQRALDQQRRANTEDAFRRFHAARARSLLQRLSDPAAHRYDRVVTPQALSQLRALTTTPQVQDWLRQTFPRITFHIEGATPTAARAMAEEFATLARAHPYAAARLDHIVYVNDPHADVQAQIHALGADPGRLSGGKEMSDLSGRTTSLGQNAAFESGIAFTNAALDDTHPEFQQAWKLQSTSNWMPVRDPGVQPGQQHPAAYVMRHEFGHVIHEYLKRASGQQAQILDYLEYASTHTDPTAISRYAARNPNEHFAEAFAASEFGNDTQRADSFTQTVQRAAEAFA